jgi:uncharacterized damage-inducible protein DinB
MSTATQATELDTFFKIWDQEAQKTIKLMRSLPKDKYDYRPDAGARSMGEMAWHLAELDGYTGFCLEVGSFALDTKVPNLERPRTVDALAAGYERVHKEAVDRLRKLTAADLDRSVTYFTGDQLPIRDVLWSGLLYHTIHHRGQLSLMNRMAGGKSPSMFGPNREEMAALRAKAGG